MTIDYPPLEWQVELSRRSDLSEHDQAKYGEILDSYGGLVRPGFRRYRAAELCARSIRSLLGVETTIALASGVPLGRPSHP